MTFRQLLPIAIVISLSCLSTNLAAQPSVDLSEGTLFINGGLSVRYTLIGFDKPQHNFALLSDLGGGYFVLDRLSVGLSVPATWNFASGVGGIHMERRGEIGIKLLSTYYFNIEGSLSPYVGAQATPGYSMGDKTFQLSAGIDGGMLVALSQSVALDIGLRPELHFKLFDTQKWQFSLPAGFLGVRAFF